MPPQTLVPGYKQVEAFGPDDEYEEEEEVFYVTLDLGAVEPTLVPSSSGYRLIGLDTPTPYLQLAGSIFQGRHDSLLGTELLFTEEKHDTDRTKRSLVHAGTTEQRICFKEVQLIQKNQAPVAGSSADAASPPSNGSAPPDASSKTGTQADEPDQYLERLTGRKSATPPRKRGRPSKKGKEKAVDVQGDSAMDTT
ncbi:hypothetical protein ID866_5884 [Astraeus odoratus]|nr:hypothetical protein ID866_5884 [Astraeus odoratus]